MCDDVTGVEKYHITWWWFNGLLFHMTQLRFNGLLFHMTHDSGSVVQWFFVSYDSINKGKYTTEKKLCHCNSILPSPITQCQKVAMFQFLHFRNCSNLNLGATGACYQAVMCPSHFRRVRVIKNFIVSGQSRWHAIGTK